MNPKQSMNTHTEDQSMEDGGPAFPMPMTMMTSEHIANEPEFGMTLRDYFAAKAMQSITSVLHSGIRPVDLGAMARDAYGIADAMLNARKT
jgi:hypothetical protein